MAELVSVERMVTEELLEAGEISLGPAEANKLGLGDHTTDLTLTADGEALPAVWIAGRRRLSGEPLTEYLQDTAVIDGLLRLERRGGALNLVVLGPASRLRSVPRAAAPAVERVAPAGAAAVDRRPVTPQRRVSNRYRLRQRDEYAWREGVGFLRDARAHLTGALTDRGWDPSDAVRLRLDGERLATLDQFDELLAVDAAHIEHMPHQEAAARKVLARMGGRGILADEVGLGKTVEAGLVLKELILRGLARRVLIICPAPLRDQWRDELRDKFDEDFTVVSTGRDPKAFAADRIIVTLQLAMRNAEHLRRGFDLVIIDEAHRLSGAGATRTREVIERLIAKSPRVLFLSATPVQNNLLELYRLVELLRPGTFRSERDFSLRFVDSNDPRRPVNAPELRRLISSVVVRTTRQQAGVDRVHRMPPLDKGVELTPPERQLYDMVLHTLRHRMTAPGDTMRRRQLALRLTASPQAVSRSALRMAAGTGDAELRRILTEIGHLAGDIRHTSREQAALGVIQGWLKEHGRVLVFTQHTDTLTGILRLLAEAGITAAPFHGAMAHSQRSESVKRFRAGDAPVLVSTDAGAEGQNLQVSNCVLNYDLPWNPMRVEQRIGRVHRLTQTRDVHIANLFARNTLDERVYRLLHDKLAMFELLFGQVVTVLGELDGKQDASMESRVLEALYSNSDRTMQKRLDELGEQLADARSRAATMMTADSGLSEWLAQRREERAARAAAPEARDLMPQAAEKPRRRQKDLERFVRGFFTDAGARVTTPADDLISVKLPAELAGTFGVREELHLAFTSAALDHHPDAQLCVVGSEVFDDILAAQRSRGDLTGSVARLPGLHQQPVLRHDPRIRLAWRRAEPGDDWSARATYRVQEDVASGNQQLVTVQVGTTPAESEQRTALGDGAEVPGGLRPAEVLDRVEDEAVRHLKQHLGAAREAEELRQAEAQETLVRNLRKQLKATGKAIAASNSRAEIYQQILRQSQLERAIEDASRPRPPLPDTELRAELLTLELHGSPRLTVVERWEHDGGTARELRYPWTGSLGSHTPVCEASGEPISTLALCAAGHAVDHDALHRCEPCDGDWCGACGPARTLAPCTGCGRAACHTCRDGGGLCTGCRRPARAPELDTEWERAWRLGADAYLLVGEGHAVHVTGADRRTLVPERDTADPVRSRVRAVAFRLGLPLSAGLVAALGEPADDELTEGAIWAGVERSAWWTAEPGHGHAVDADLTRLLPELPGPQVTGERSAGLETLLRELRGRGPLPAVPAVAAVPFAVVRRVDVHDGRFRYRERWHEGDREPMTAFEVVGTPEPSGHEPVPGGRAVAAMRLGPVQVEVDGLHRSYLCLVTDGTRTTTVFVPGIDGATLRAEHQLALRAGDPGRVLTRHPWRPAVADLDFSEPAPAAKVRRRTTVATALLADVAGAVPETDALSSAEPPADLRAAVTVDDAVLRASFGERDRRLTPVAVGTVVAVEEEWRSRHGSAAHRYLVGAGRLLQITGYQDWPLLAPDGPLEVPLADGSRGHRDVSVDSHGHLFDAGRAAQCPVCDHVYGPCCGETGSVQDCPDCVRPACGSCRTADAGVVATRCERCGDQSCGSCSRHLPLTGCRLCGRSVCGPCGVEGLCGTCANLTPATAGQIAALPEVLAATGLAVLIGADAGATVAILAGPHRRELAVLDATGLRSWQTGAADEMLPLRLEAARRSGGGDADVLAVEQPPRPQIPQGTLPLESDGSAVVQWALAGDTTPPAGRFELPAGTATVAPGDDLVAELTAILEPSGRLPEAVDGSVILAAARLASVPPARARLVGRRFETETAVVVDGRGLARYAITGDSVSARVARWQEPDEAWPWLTEGWNPAPAVLRVAALAGWSAAIVAVGGFALLGVRHGDQAPQWWRISEPGTEEDLHRALLGAMLAGGKALATVTGLPAGDRLVGPTISGGRLIERTMSYEITEDTGAAAATPSAEALAQLTPATVAGAPPVAGELPARLAADLRDLARAHRPAEVRVSIGLNVKEIWQLETGRPLTIDYHVPGGAIHGHLPHAVTGRPLYQVRVCRARHLVDWTLTCATCRTETCVACDRPARPCVLCQGPVCGPCTANPDGRCPACAGLQKIGLFGRGKFGVSMADGVWHGVGVNTTTTIRRVRDTWTLERSEGEHRITLPLDGALVQRFLE